MELTRAERRKYQKQLAEALKGLKKPEVSRAERRAFQKDIVESHKALKLGKYRVAPEEVAKPTRMEKLLAGEFNHYDPVPFIELVESIYEEENPSLNEIKQPVIAYYQANMAA